MLKYEDDSLVLKEFKLKTLTPGLGEIGNSKHFIFDIREYDQIEKHNPILIKYKQIIKLPITDLIPN